MDEKQKTGKPVTGQKAAETIPRVISVRPKKSDYDEMMKQVDISHLPNKEQKNMNSVLHKADTRGSANHGWLEAKHTFSFGSYQDPNRVHFGMLRVLNDDKIAGGMGFGTHPHDNMEIITIPLEGALSHKDSMGNGTTIKAGDVQVMSAGKGILHSEFNASETEFCKLLQIWVFPNNRGVEPRYDQITLNQEKMKNNFLQIISPNLKDEGVWIHQNAWFHLGEFDKDQRFSYELKDKSNGVYIFLINGKINANGQELEQRDGFGVWETDKIDFKTLENSKILLMEIPMEVK
ncbi:MAG: pirin family protein [Crocinitomicaceae bacterium]|jgi:redox-sensitive bicupin YhaK (pirin superfamily)|nr:pirin family protein [Crocinitomicaceae bacterium]